MAHDIPYLNGIRAFESAARLGGFSKAAGELHVTAPAVSRMVKLLEERLGVTLFDRHPNGLTLTPAGETYSAGLGPILDQLSALTERVAQSGAPRTLTVGVGPTFAIRWLIPRLAAFRAQEPEIDVHITTGGAAAPFSDAWTCGIALGDGAWPGLEAEVLFRADLTPVCTPETARRLSVPEALPPELLLRVQHAPDDWPRWLAAAGASAPVITASGPEFEFYGQALQAALDGLGVAMGIRPYIDDDLIAGRLVTPFDLGIPKDAAWYLVFRADRRNDPTFETFRRWLIERAHGIAKPADLA